MGRRRLEPGTPTKPRARSLLSGNSTIILGKCQLIWEGSMIKIEIIKSSVGMKLEVVKVRTSIFFWMGFQTI